MKKKSVSTKHELTPLITELLGLIHSARHAAATTVNTLQVLTNFEIGRRIVEHEQKGAERAVYGELMMHTLAEQLTEAFGRGFSKRNLDYMRRFHLDYADRLSRIVQKPSAQLLKPPKSQLVDQLPNIGIWQKPSAKSPFSLSWFHYILLMTIKKTEEPIFCEIESTQSGWSLPELKRQVALS